MQLTIDNLDGNGAVNYGPAVVSTGPLTVTRQMGRWTTCTATLDTAGSGLSVPVSGGRVLVLSDAGATLFAGYITRTPQPHAGVQAAGGEAQLVLMQAAEDAWLVGTAPVASLQPAASRTHAVSLETDALTLSPMAADALSLLAADVTLSGAVEATTYATELFAGDGTTEAFALMDTPYRASGSEVLLTDSFDASQFRAQVWTLVDPGQHIGFGSGGLLLSGGNGFDGQTTMVAANRGDGRHRCCGVKRCGSAGGQRWCAAGHVLEHCDHSELRGGLSCKGYGRCEDDCCAGQWRGKRDGFYL